MEGDDQQDPIVDAVRSFLDGHIVLSRTLAAAGHYPPIEVLDSLSRLMPSVTTREHRSRASEVRRLLATYAKNEDFVRIGAYKPGADEELDRAMQAVPEIARLLQQESDEHVTLEQSISDLCELAI